MIYTNKLVDRETLRHVPIPERGDRSERWHGQQHGQLVDLIEQRIRFNGLVPMSDKWSLFGPQGEGLIGGFEIADPTGGGRLAPVARTLQLGVMHSNDSSRALKFVAGVCVQLCTNGMVQGEYTLRTLHTSGLPERLEREIDQGLGRWSVMVQHADDHIAAWQQAYIPPRQRDRLIVETGRRGLLPWSHVGKWVDEMDHPSFPEMHEYGDRAWGVYGAFTHIAKQRPEHDQMRVIGRFGQLMDEQLAA